MKRSDYRKFRVRPLAFPATGTGPLAETAVTGTGPLAETAVAGTGPLAETAVAGRSPRPRDTVFLDDFAAMKQVVGRRYRRVLEDGGPFPDLVVIDGGMGQLNAAYDALQELGLANLMAIGLAKKEELVFTRDSDLPIAMDPHGAALRLLQRIRDEAHRFAVTFHRESRARRDFRSELDAVPGIGPRRRKALLTRFGSLTGVRRATREELIAVVGARAADSLLQFFATH